jgi:hypothetical protein
MNEVIFLSSYAVYFFLIPVGLAFAIAILLWALYHNPTTGIWLVAALAVWETWEIKFGALALGLAIYPEDVVFGLMAAVALVRLLRARQWQTIPGSWGLLGCGFLISFAIGLVKNGTAAGVDFREDFYVWTGVAYFLSFTLSREQVTGFARAWITAALSILAIAYFRWASDVFNLDWVDPLWHYADSTGVAFRVISSGQTLILAQALILLVYALASGKGMRAAYLLIPFLAITVIVLQHRSVWAAALVPLLFSVILIGKGRTGLIGKLAVIAVSTAIVVAPFAAGGGGAVTASVADSAQRATSTTEGTFAGRVEGWKLLLDEYAHAGPVVNLFGHPYGSGYERFLGGVRIGYAPHNYYIQTLLRTGAIGLAALVMTYWMLLRLLRRDREYHHPDVPAAAMVALLISQLLYFVPYSPNFAQGVILGIALSLVRDRIAGWRQPVLAAEVGA